MYELSKQVYLDRFDNQYKTIVTLQPKPTDGSLDDILRTVSLYKYDSVNPFRDPNLGWNSMNGCSCYYGFTGSFDCNGTFIGNGKGGRDEFVTIDMLPKLLITLSQRGYTIDYTFSKLMYKNKNSMNRDFIGFIMKK